MVQREVKQFFSSHTDHKWQSQSLWIQNLWLVTTLFRHSRLTESRIGLVLVSGLQQA